MQLRYTEISKHLLLSRGPFRDLLIPEAVMGFRPSRGHFSSNDGSEAAADHGCAHIDVNDESADRGQRRDNMNGDSQITQPAQTPRDGFNKPQPEARDQQQDHAITHQPEEQFLPVVEASDWGQ